jgi:hypothetical protein
MLPKYEYFFFPYPLQCFLLNFSGLLDKNRSLTGPKKNRSSTGQGRKKRKIGSTKSKPLEGSKIVHNLGT